MSTQVKLTHYRTSEPLNRKARFYSLTRAGRKQLEKEARDWERTTGIIARFFSPEES